MSDKEKEENMNIINELSALLGKIGWAIAIPDQEAVDHLIVGKFEVVDEITASLITEYDILEKDKVN